MRTTRSEPGWSRIGVGQVGAVGMRPARHVNARREQHIALEVHVTEVAARPDVDVLVDSRADLREQRAELDRGGRRAAALEDTSEKRAAEVLAGQAWNERQHLR